MAGMFDLGNEFYQSPQRQGMMRGGIGILSQGDANSRALAGMFGGMVDGGQHAYRAQQEQAQAEAMRQMQELKMRAMQGDIQAEEAARALEASIQAELSGQSGAAPPQQPRGPEPQGATPGFTPPNSGTAPQGSQADILARLQHETEVRMRRGDRKGAMSAYEALQKLQPKFDQTPRVGQRPDGTPFTYVLDERGNQKELAGVLPRDELHFADGGGFNYGQDKFTGAIKSRTNKSQTLESIASNATTMRGQNMTDARSREMAAITREGQNNQIINDPTTGITLVNKRTGVARPAVGMDGRPLLSEAEQKRQGSSNRVLPILTQAEKLIDSATGSGIGAGVDAGLGFFGVASAGANATAKLRALEGNLMMSQPRMEGPQSDKDVLLYRQMAGQIGDPSVPASMKKAALEQIRTLAQKYASPGAVAEDNAARNQVPSDVADLLNKYGGK